MSGSGSGGGSAKARAGAGAGAGAGPEFEKTDAGGASFTIIQGGTVVDPSLAVNPVAATTSNCDVILNRDGTIRSTGVGAGAALMAAVPPGSSDTFEVFNAAGLLVTPGLIDIHVHGYTAATPLGVAVDDKCLARGVTTAVDAGSAGAATLHGLRKLVAEQCQTRLLAFVHVCLHGLASAGCSGGANVSD